MRYYTIKLDKDDEFTTLIDETMFLAIYHAGMIDPYDDVTMTQGTYHVDMTAHRAYNAAINAQIESAYKRRAQIIHRMQEIPKIKE